LSAGGLASSIAEDSEVVSKGLQLSWVGELGSSLVDCFVERRPARSWSRWPLIVAMERGAYFRTCEEVRLGQDRVGPHGCDSFCDILM
jgi:hypothetical protein